MFRRHLPSPEPEDPCVTPVERILAAAAERSADVAEKRDGKPVVTHALWLCACVTENDAPIWLIYDTGDAGVAWRRVPDRVQALDLVEARFSAGGHVDPAEVLDWLEGGSSLGSWSGGSVGGDRAVLEELGRRLRGPEAR